LHAVHYSIMVAQNVQFPALKLFSYGVWGSHGSQYQGFSLVGCEAIWFGRWMPTLWNSWFCNI